MKIPADNWQCSSKGPQNNKLVPKCEFTFYFDDVHMLTPHCPVCGHKMKRVVPPNSVGNLLRRGLEEERKK